MELGVAQIKSSSPADMIEKAETVGINKANLGFFTMVVLSVLAGLFIGFGAVASSIMASGASGVLPYGLTKILSGLVFCVGLILVVISGAELFTGNLLMVIALIRQKISWISLLRNWIIVYLGNFAGSMILAILIFFSGEYLFSDGALGKVMLSTGLLKVSYPFLRAFILGVLCNTLVCLAVWMTYSAQSITDKILAILFPITTFIAAGFEHSVANMYIIPVSLLIKYWDPAFTAKISLDLGSLTWKSFLLNNLLPVTLGNILGGSLFVGIAYAVAYPVKSHKTSPSS